MFYTEEDAKEFIAENDVKFVRLAFCDIFGTQKNVSIMPTELDRALKTGIPIDASAIPGFGSVEQSDLFLKPCVSTLSPLPWRPSHGRVVRFYCDVTYPDGRPFELCSRTLLKNAIARARKAGLSCNIGAECEFYLFKTDEDGKPTDVPLDNGTYMCIAPEDRAENIRREICLTLEEMGILPESSHHEQGPGQNEIDFRYSDPLSSADNVTTFRSVVRTVAARNGLYASFDPKPLDGFAGNGFHINISPAADGIEEKKFSQTEHLMAGILEHICEMCAFLNPTAESYRRLGNSKSPRYVSWAYQNRSQLIRIPAPCGDGTERFELRSPDSGANPYIAYALLIHAGLDGIENGTPLPEPVTRNMYELGKEEKQNYQYLPRSLGEALLIAADSEFIRKYLPEKLIEGYRQRNEH